MKRWLGMVPCFCGALVAAWWLAGYGRVVWICLDGWPFWPDLKCFVYPNIKWYSEFDERTGQMSEEKIEWFSLTDGPTGIIYAHRYFPCWIVSLAATGVLIACVAGMVVLWPRDRADGE